MIHFNIVNILIIILKCVEKHLFWSIQVVKSTRIQFFLFPCFWLC